MSDYEIDGESQGRAVRFQFVSLVGEIELDARDEDGRLRGVAGGVCGAEMEGWKCKSGTNEKEKS